MKILLTGATGFIGTNFVLRLHHKYQITAIVRPSSDTSKINRYCNIYQYDGDIQSLIDFCNQEKFDGVVHLAAYFCNQHNLQNITSLIDGNLTFGLHILEAIYRSHTPLFFLNTLTFSQFMNSSSYNPKTFYDAMKQAFYDAIQFYINHLHTLFVHLLLFNPYGTNETTEKIFHIWNRISNTQECLNMGAGNHQIDVTHIDDVIDAYDTLIQLCKNKKVKNNYIYSTESNSRYTLRELALIFEQITGKKLKITWGEETSKNTIKKPISSNESHFIYPIPNWKPKYNIQKGLKKFLKDTQR